MTVLVAGVSLAHRRTRSITLEEWNAWLSTGGDTNRYIAATQLMLEPEVPEEYVPEREGIPDTVNMPPEPEPESDFALKEAMRSLEPDNPAHFTLSGIPRIPVLTDLMDRPVTGEERNRVWAALQEEDAGEGSEGADDGDSS